MRGWIAAWVTAAVITSAGCAEERLGYQEVGEPQRAVIVSVESRKHGTTTVATSTGLRLNRYGAWGQVGDTLRVVEERMGHHRRWRGVTHDGERW